MRQDDVIESFHGGSQPQTEHQLDKGLREVVLSDFAGKKALELHESRHNEYADKMLEHQRTVQDLTLARQDALAEAKNALSCLDLLKALKAWIRSVQLNVKIRRTHKRAPVIQDASVEELQAKAGSDAEKRLDEYLRSRLDAKWTLISGYSGDGGEIDRILVGPKGIFAFEIKGNRGVVYSDGALWWAERLNRRGNLAYRKDLERAPDVQLNKAVRWLAGWLMKKRINLPIIRIVLFTAPDAKIGQIKDADADIVTTLHELDLEYLFNLWEKRYALPPEDCERIAGLINKDHDFCYRNKVSKGRLGQNGTEQ